MGGLYDTATLHALPCTWQLLGMYVATTEKVGEHMCARTATYVLRGGVCCRGPHRLVVRTSRRGRDNPGSTPGEDMYTIKNIITHSNKSSESSFALQENLAERF